LQALLKHHDKNLENALSKVQRQYLQAETRFETSQSAISAMFDLLNAALERRQDLFAGAAVRRSGSDRVA
jgi:hypothetical protein